MSGNLLNKFKQLTRPGESLGQRTSRAAMWVVVSMVLSQVLNLVRTVVLARVLAPGDIGLMGIALLALSSLDSFTQTGLSQALIQKKEDVREYIDTSWTVNGIRGLVLCVLLVLAAPYVGVFFNEPAAVPIVRVIALSFLIGGWSSMGLMYFYKEMEFSKRFYYDIGGTLVDFIVAVAAVLILHNVWALVFGLLAGSIARFVLSYCLHSYRPRFRFEWAKVRELSGYGRWILVSSVLVFIINYADSVVVGRLLAASALGFYQMAYRFSNTPITQINFITSQVAFPAYSKLQDNLPKLRETYLKILQLITFISIPLTVGIFVLAPDFVQVFLGEKWLPIIPSMRVLAVAGLLQLIIGTVNPLVKGVGKPYLDTRWQVIRLVVLGVLIYPMTLQWGLLGASLALCFSVIVSLVGYTYNAVKITGCGVKNFCRLIVFPLIGGIIMALFLFVVKAIIHKTGLGEFILFVFLGILCYLAVIYLQDKLFNYKIRLLIRESLASLKGV